MTRSGGKVTITSVPMRSFDFSAKVPPCRSIRFLAIGRPRPAPCSADLIEFEPWPNEASTIGISSSGMPGPVSLTLMYCPPEAVQPTLSQISPPCGVNLMALDSRLRQIWRTARSSAHSRGMSGSNSSCIVMPRLLARSLSRWWQSSTTRLSDTGLLVELVAAGLDARQIEDFVDQAEQVHAGTVDVAGIFLVRRHRVGAENLALHHFGEAEDGVEWRAQLVAHLGEEARLGDIGGFGAPARLVGNRLRLFELADQRVLLRARFERRQRRRVEPIGKQGEIAFAPSAP